MDMTAHWFLDSVIYNWYPVWWLGAPADELEMMINHTTHGLTPEQVAAALHELQQSGNLAIYGPTLKSTHSEDEGMVAREYSLAQLEEAVKRNHHLSYGLTTQGGAQWEAVAQPMWDRYLNIEWITDFRRRVTAINHDFVTRYLTHYTYHNPEEVIVPGSLLWSVAKPWDATYWKTLPTAAEATFTVLGQEMEQDPAWHEQRWPVLQAWYADSTWYTSYDALVSNNAEVK